MTNFEMDAEHAAGLGAPIDDVTQEAIDATATILAAQPQVDVERELVAELRSRGITGVAEDWLAETARAIRSGHSPQVGHHDGSIRAEGRRGH